MHRKKFEINNYVLYKYKDEWLECRIKDIIKTDAHSPNIILFIIKYSVVNNEPVSEDCIYKSTFENEKKFKVVKTYRVPAFLINFLREDKTKIKNNFVIKLVSDEIVKKPGRKPKNEAKGKGDATNKKVKNVKSIVNDFIDFFGKNKATFDEELEEARTGINFLFCNIIKNLLYDKEMKQFGEITAPYNEVYGIEHLCRLFYYCIDKNDILNEYAYYFCDFLDLNYETYFLDRKYEELK